MKDKKELFYQRVADILEAEHTYKFYNERLRRNRWLNREAGNGRYDGHGCVRYFSENAIHVMLTYPRLNAHFKNEDDALAAISKALVP